MTITDSRKAPEGIKKFLKFCPESTKRVYFSSLKKYLTTFYPHLNDFKLDQKKEIAEEMEALSIQYIEARAHKQPK